MGLVSTLSSFFLGSPHLHADARFRPQANVNDTTTFSRSGAIAIASAARHCWRVFHCASAPTQLSNALSIPELFLNLDNLYLRRSQLPACLLHYLAIGKNHTCNRLQQKE